MDLPIAAETAAEFALPREVTPGALRARDGVVVVLVAVRGAPPVRVVAALDYFVDGGA